MLSAPPASAKSASPSSSACTAETIAWAPEPQNYYVYDDCRGPERGLVARTHVGGSGNAGFLTGAVGIVLWGLRDQQRLAINVGVLGFACAVLGFYFSSLYDKLGRALGLIGIGVLFIGGGWLLERARRRLIARMQAGRS